MMGSARIAAPKKPTEIRRLLFASAVGLIVGLSVGITSTKYGLMTGAPLLQAAELLPFPMYSNSKSTSERSVKGAEVLPPGIVAATTDLYLRRLWGNPDEEASSLVLKECGQAQGDIIFCVLPEVLVNSEFSSLNAINGHQEDLPFKQKYLVTFTVGFQQKDIVKAAISKFSSNWTIVLFHYDGLTTEWEQFEWSRRAIHISARRQSKWWFAKRFLHPDVVEPYEYIFIWDEDLDVEHFNAEEYIRLVKKHGLEISQPGLEPDRGLTWQMTKRLGNSEVHKSTEEKPGWCPDPHKPPCAGFVEIMAPVFSREAWRCVWHMIQNDLVHGWGLDFTLGKCAEPAHEKIGVVDSQYIVHKVVPSLGNQGSSVGAITPREGVRQRCHLEWNMYKKRMDDAERALTNGTVES